MSSPVLVPSVRSRLWASGAAFILGFGLANYAIFMIERPDQWLWLAAAGALMATSAAGILFADSPRPVSMWAILGVEVFALLTLLPLLWTFTVATSTGDESPRSLWPQDVSWSAFGDALGSGVVRDAAVTSATVSALATLVAVPLGLAAAYALVRQPVRGGRAVYVLVVSLLVVPLIALAVPITDQLVALGLDDSRWALVPPLLLVTLPLTIWFGVTLMRDVPWTLLDAVRADGANRRQQLRMFAVPHLGAGVVVLTLLVFVAGCQDFVLGAAIAADDSTRPLPATLLLVSGTEPLPSSTVAAAGLLWLVPPLLLLLVFPRRIHRLLGRSYR